MKNYNRSHEERVYRRIIAVTIAITLVYIVLYSYLYYSSEIPDNITITVDKKGIFKADYPMTIDFEEDSIDAISINNQKITSQNKSISLNNAFSLESSTPGDYSATIKALGFINLKDIRVNVIKDKKLIPGGIPLGIYMETDGLLVLGIEEIKDISGKKVSPAKGLVQVGDYILEIEGQEVLNKQDLIHKLDTLSIDKEKVRLKIRRGKKHIFVDIICAKLNGERGNPEKKLGLWIRNDMQGIGTLSYYDLATNTYGALGHGISDVDTSMLMDIKKGQIFDAEILKVEKSKAGHPGEIVGVINYGILSCLGEIYKNTYKGIYGSADKEQEKYMRALLNKRWNGEKEDAIGEYKIALKQDIKKGDAILRCQVDKEIKDYDITIEDIRLNAKDNKCFVVKITDKSLLRKTGGIVQGMSGSPILQNGKIIGALTHVFVKDTSKGYGIFIENMLAH